jgi:hypothetical protein
MDLTMLQTSGLILIILLAYAVISFTVRRRSGSKFYLLAARLIAVAATAFLALWPILYDAIFVEHFPDEATMPGPAFAMLFFIILSSSLWAPYALFRAIVVAFTKARK